MTEAEFDFEESYTTAMMCRIERRYHDAIRLCTHILDRRDLTARERVVALELRGTCKVRLRQYGAADRDLTDACTLAERHRLELEYIHASTSHVRSLIAQNRGYTAAKDLLPELEEKLKRRRDPESRALRASVAGLFGVIYFRNGRGWYTNALACFEKAKRLSEGANDPLRYLRALSRLSFTLAWMGSRLEARRYAGDMIRVATHITEHGDPQSRFVGRYIQVVCLLPIPIRLMLFPFRRHAGL